MSTKPQSIEEMNTAREGKKALLETWEEMDKDQLEYGYQLKLRAKVRAIEQRIRMKSWSAE